jgi:hypothetical protein
MRNLLTPKTITIDGLSAAPGEKINGYISVPDTDAMLPATIINSTRPGKTLLLTAGIHSCEYIGIEASMRLARQLEPEDIAGAIICIHITNPCGFEERVQTINPCDGKNLNRLFPAQPNGSETESIALFMQEALFPLADFYLDLHSGEAFEDLLPYIYYIGVGPEEAINASREAARSFAVPYIVRSTETSGAYNHAGTLGIPSLLLERGCAARWSEEEVAMELYDIYNLLRHLHILPGEPNPPAQKAYEFVNVKYPMSESSGLWYPQVRPGESLRKGQLLGIMQDYMGNELKRYYAEFDAITFYIASSLAMIPNIELLAYGEV